MVSEKCLVQRLGLSVGVLILVLVEDGLGELQKKSVKK